MAVNYFDGTQRPNTELRIDFETSPGSLGTPCAECRMAQLRLPSASGPREIV
jgi:hypothetical protein